MKYYVLFIFVLTPLYLSASLTKKQGHVFTNEVYLNEKVSKQLQLDLIRNNFSEETFNITFHCDKYKRKPSSKKRSLNCRALSASPSE
tara:strand:+ start:11335 stop:11598 length:264 start_codon:yes stop_codon:yes gene_type:complete